MESRVVGKKVIFEYKGKLIEEILYKEKCGKLRINPLFSSLWSLPWDLESYTYIYTEPGQTEDVSFVLPKLSKSKFVGSGSCDYELIQWNYSSPPEGPVKINGKQLYTDMTGVDLKVEWKSKTEIQIGFYCNIRSLGEDFYPLIDKNNNFQLKSGKSGSFVIENYEDIFVAISSDEKSEVELSFDVIIPQKLDPFVLDKYYLYFCYKGEKYKLFVADLPVLNNCIVQPILNKSLEKLYNLIMCQYIKLSLPLSYAEELEAKSLLVSGYTNVDTYYRSIIIDPDSNNIGFVVLQTYTRTDNLNSNARLGRISDLLNLNPYLGFNIQPVQSSAIVSYKITITPPPEITKLNLLCVVAYYFTNPNVWQMLPYEIIVNDVPVGNNHLWPDQSSFLIEGEVEIPAAYSNFILSVRAGSKTAYQPFRYGGVKKLDFPNFVKFNEVDVGSF